MRSGSKPVASHASWNGWGADDLNTRFQGEAWAALSAADVPNLKVKWAFGYPNGRTAYGQPTVVDGRVYTGSNDGTIYFIDALNFANHPNLGDPNLNWGSTNALKPGVNFLTINSTANSMRQMQIALKFVF